MPSQMKIWMIQKDKKINIKNYVTFLLQQSLRSLRHISLKLLNLNTGINWKINICKLNWLGSKQQSLAHSLSVTLFKYQFASKHTMYSTVAPCCPSGFTVKDSNTDLPPSAHSCALLERKLIVAGYSEILHKLVRDTARNSEKHY